MWLKMSGGSSLVECCAYGVLQCNKAVGIQVQVTFWLSATTTDFLITQIFRHNTYTQNFMSGQRPSSLFPTNV